MLKDVGGGAGRLVENSGFSGDRLDGGRLAATPGGLLRIARLGGGADGLLKTDSCAGGLDGQPD